MSDLENRIRRLEDRAELQDLVVRYFVASDDDDYDTLAQLFSPDGAFTGQGFVGGSDHEQVMAFIRNERKNMGPTVHTPNFTLFTFLDDDHATGIVGAHLELSRSGRTLFGAVRYHDEYIRIEGKWHFRKRELLTIHIGPWEDIGTSLTVENNVRWPGYDPARSQFPKKK